jgi:hypothetical protein
MAPAGGALPQATGAARVTVSLDWPQFLHDPQHSSVSPATAFMPANAGSDRAHHGGQTEALKNRGCAYTKNEGVSPFRWVEAMRMRLHRRNLVVADPSVSSADRNSAPRFTHISHAVRTHQRPIFLVVGALLLVLGVALPSTVAFVSGMLVMALGAPNAGPHSSEAAMVRTWEWLHKNRAGH